MNAFKQFWLQYADFSGRTSRAHFWLAFFWNFLISLPLWVFFIVADVSHQAGKDSLPLSNLQALPVLWSLAFLVFFYFLIFVPSQAICVRRLRDAGIHWSWIFLNLGPILFYLVTSLEVFLFIWLIGAVALLILLMFPAKNAFPQPVVHPTQVATETQLRPAADPYTSGSFGQIPSFVAAPDLSGKKTPLEQKMAAEHEQH